MNKKIKFVIPILTLILIFSFALACGGGNNTPSTVEKTEEPEEGTTKEKLTVPETFHCGDEIIFYDSKTDNPICSLMIHSIENYTEYEQFDAPDEGMRYIAIDVEIKNLSEEIQKCDKWYNYALRDADNYMYGNIYGGIPKEPRLNSGDIISGDTVRGWITFVLPVDVEIIEILAETCSCSPPAIIVVKDPLF